MGRMAIDVGNLPHAGAVGKVGRCWAGGLPRHGPGAGGRGANPLSARPAGSYDRPVSLPAPHRDVSGPATGNGRAGPAAPGRPGRRILVAVPIFNEIRYLARMLERLAEFPHDKLFVDDGSTDGTLDVLGEAERRGQIAVIRHPKNQGYGAALIDAFKYADAHGYDWVITIDCDEQHDPAAIPCFVREIERDEADLISGSRYLRPQTNGHGDCYAASYDGDDLPPVERRAVNLIITATLNSLFGWTLTDTFCGFKAHRTKPTVALNLDEPGYAFPLQLWPRVQAAGLRVRELPVRLIYKDTDRTFGHDVRAGDLDNAKTRLGHYLDVLREELCQFKLPKLREAGLGVLDELPDTVPGGLRDTLRTSFEAAAAVPCP